MQTLAVKELYLLTYLSPCAVRGKYYNGRHCHGADGQGPQATHYKICGQTDESGNAQAYGVCGLKTRVSPRSAYDEHGLTDIELQCCKDPKCKLFMEANAFLHLKIFSINISKVWAEEFSRNIIRILLYAISRFRGGTR